MTYEYGQDERGEWSWRLRTADDRILAMSGERYENESDCVDAIILVKHARNAPLKKIERM